MSTPKSWLLGWWYPRGRNVHQQRHRPSGVSVLNFPLSSFLLHVYMFYCYVFPYSTLARGIERGLRSHKTCVTSTAFLCLSQVRSLWPLLVLYVFNFSSFIWFGVKCDVNFHWNSSQFIRNEIKTNLLLYDVLYFENNCITFWSTWSFLL